ncbi:MAG: NAD+ synthase [Gammaproteobacteria bacterium]
MGSLRIALAQLNLTVGDIQGNAQRILAAAEEARDRVRADLVVFPELSLSGYPPEDLVLRPGLWHQVESALAEISRRVRGVELLVGYPRRHEGRLFNACSLIGTGRIKATYHKQHLPNYSVFDEKRYFVPGRAAQVVEIKGIALALSICEDIWIGGTASQARDAGAQAIVNINASPFHLGKAAEREQVLRRACEEAGLPILYVNLVGGQDELVFDGGSTVVDADGSVRLRAPDFTEGLYTVDLDPGTPVCPKLGEVVPPREGEEGIYQALVLGVRDYARKNGFRGAVLGLSGGIDSALTLAVAVDALSKDAVEAVVMPSRFSAEMSLTDAAEEARRLGVAYHTIPIEPAVRAFEESLRTVFAGRPRDTTEENVQARCRGVILMALSNKTGKLVLFNLNNSVMAVGFF